MGAAIDRDQSRSEEASATRLALAAMIGLAVVIAASVYPLVGPLDGFAFWSPSPAGQAIWGLTEVAWLVTMLVTMARHPNGRLWKLILLLVVVQSLDAVQTVPNSWAFSLGVLLAPLQYAVFIHLMLAFPSGRLRDGFARFVVAFASVALLVTELLKCLTWDYVYGCNPDCIRNVFVVWPDWDAFGWLFRTQAALGGLVIVPLALWAFGRSWRAASPAARRALVPFAVAIPLLAVVTLLDILSRSFAIGPILDFFGSPAGQVVRWLTPAILPAGLLIGLLRARWVRGRIAGLVVELGRGVPLGGLRDVLARTLDDPTLQLAFAAPSGSGFVDAEGRQVDLPLADSSRMVTRLQRDDELLGVIVHDPAIETEDPGLVEVVGNAARLALENERLAAEVRAQLEAVRASRARIVEAADAERRRVERNLHDGAQQRLVALAVRLQLAKETSPGASELLDEATVELQTAISEVRSLARGVHPTILTEAGLGAAVDALAERAAVPVSIDVPERRYPAPIEATAYYVIAEALANVARYAHATRTRVQVAEDHDRLVVTVTDDGRGGADPAAGSGLRGLADRVAAIGGGLAVVSPPGQGTIVRAQLPIGTAGGGAMPDATTTTAASSEPAPAAGAHALGRVHAVTGVTPRPGPISGRPRGVTASNPAVLALAVVGLIGSASAVAGFIGQQTPPPVNGRADSFVRPFVFQVPGNSGIRLFDGALSRGHSRDVHVLAASPLSGEGISIWAVQDVIADPCDPEGRTIARQPGVAGLLAHLRSLDRLEIRNETPTTVDGRAATQIDVLARDGITGCPTKVMGLWSAATGKGWMGVPDSARVRVIVLDVDGETIAIEIWRADNLDAWLPRAMPIVDSIRFINGPPASNGPASTTP